MTEYTLGFVFTPGLKEILLISRGEHKYHSHKSNGLGGKIIIGESPVECVIREVKEEAGLETKEQDWKFMGVINGISWKVWVFSSVVDKKEQFSAIKEGTLAYYPITSLPENIVSNLSWIIPFCIDKLNDLSLQSFVAWYAGDVNQTS